MLPPRLIDIYLLLLSLLLLGYALLGKGFAYIGYGPLYVGEITLILGSFALYRLGPQIFISLFSLFRTPATTALVLFMLWGLYRTVPYIHQFGLLALRDSVIWSYAAYAFITALLLLSRPSSLSSWIRSYGILATVFIVAIPPEWLVTRLMDYSTTLGAFSPYIHLKAGDVLVHLAGVAAFSLSGLGRVSILRYSMVALVFVLFAFENRAGMLAFLSSMLLLLVFRPLSKAPWKLMSMAVLAVLLLWVTGIEIDMGRRQLSFNQIISNVESILFSTDDPKLEGTKSWRLAWWSKIIDYTFYGKYFWSGKGYGINLADDDGFQVLQDGSLRSPHNGHLTVLARSGVTGLALWFLAQATWALTITFYAFQSKRRKLYAWHKLFVFLLVYWWAFIVNASFDVFLEGPVGGIWFWVIYGTGLAAMTTYRLRPERFSGGG